ncbi:MAG: hypothetical protein R3324_21875, partial [Halobacteriales archaeon]|nr:hypothetical protein [Halobacteriales archaeon]
MTASTPLNRLAKLVTTTVLAATAATFSLAPTTSKADTDYGQVAMYVADMLQKHHYSREDFDDEVSARLLDTYLAFLDFSHQYFTQEDIKRFNELYRTELDDRILVGDIEPAREIYETFETRVKNRVAAIQNLLESEKFTFDSDRTVHVSRKKEGWPENPEVADQLWRNIIEGELLQEKLRRQSGAEEEDEKQQETDPDDNTTDPSASPDPDTTPESGDENQTADKETTSGDDEEETPEARILKRYTRLLESLRQV